MTKEEHLAPQNDFPTVHADGGPPLEVFSYGFDAEGVWLWFVDEALWCVTSDGGEYPVSDLASWANDHERQGYRLIIDDSGELEDWEGFIPFIRYISHSAGNLTWEEFTSAQFDRSQP